METPPESSNRSHARPCFTSLRSESVLSRAIASCTGSAPAASIWAASEKLLELRIWYAPGTGTDTIYIGTEGERVFAKVQFPINETAVPVVGDFGSSDHDDILWYRAGPATDRLWLATGDETIFETSRTVTLNGTYRPRVLTDWREDKKDRVFWYRPGDGTDPLWIFSPDATHTAVTHQVRSDLQVVAGDWSGDGVDDIVAKNLAQPADAHVDAAIEGAGVAAARKFDELAARHHAIAVREQ